MRKFKIGCNWSEPLFELINEGVEIDYIKAGEQKDFSQLIYRLIEYKDVLLHGGLGRSLRLGNIHERIDFAKLNYYINICKTPQYAIHIAFTNEEKFNLQKEIGCGHQISKRIENFRNQLKVPLLLENTPECHVEKNIYSFSPCSHPDNISNIIYSNNVDFLLDITHAKITAFYNGWDIKQYLKCLPLDRVKEIHTNGWEIRRNVVMDGHFPMEREDYLLLDWVLERTNPEIVSLEYCGLNGETKNQIKKNIFEFVKFF